MRSGRGIVVSGSHPRSRRAGSHAQALNPWLSLEVSLRANTRLREMSHSKRIAALESSAVNIAISSILEKLV